MIEEIFSISPYILYAIAFLVSLLVSASVVKSVIFITRKVKIYDTPDVTRKIHGSDIPSMGGIGIFASFMTGGAFFMYLGQTSWNLIIVSTTILFFIGIYDDIMNMHPIKKLIAQLIASGMTIYFSDVSIHSLYGLFSITEIPEWAGIIFTTLTCTFFINVFNFIDGIDGLACVLAILYTLVLGFLFAYMSHTSIACVLFSLTGATAGLLIYNKAPAKIYMGDTGSMLLGFNIFIFSVIFLKRYGIETSNPVTSIVHTPHAAMTIIVSILFLPVFDGLRVFALRISKGISPMKADRLHLHYYLLDAGLTHTKALLILSGVNVLLIALAWLLQDKESYLVMGCLLFITFLFSFVARRMKMKAN